MTSFRIVASSMLFNAALIFPMASFAQSVFTPALQTASNTFSCRVANLNPGPANIAPCIHVVNATTGSDFTSSCPSIAPGGSADVTYSPGGASAAYCEAVFSSNTQADNSRVTLFLVDSNSNAYAAVRGLRQGNSTGSTVLTGGLTAGVSDKLACRAVNTAASARTVTIDLVDDSGTVQETVGPTSVASKDSQLLGSSTGGVSRRCVVTATSGSNAKDLRVSLYLLTAVTATPPVDSYSPLEGY